MSDDKPFKTIEVVDSRTNQVCKVACMSCIRGHRTTSCGIPVCRTKIFWTVKRPGRPSNSCTCRYGATGGCKCVVARSACPHKSKKGEKRTGECRCDEQGRYCCLLEPEHWNALLALQKPSVDFFSSREALEYKQTASTQPLNGQLPSYSSITSPSSTHSIPGTPASNVRLQPVHILPNNYQGYQPMPTTTLTPRFGMMGIGAPMGSANHAAPDVLTWEGQAPPAPQDYSSHQVFEPLPPDRGSCCQGSTPSTQSIQSPPPPPAFSPAHTLSDVQLPQPYSDMPPQTVSMSQISSTAPAIDFNKFQADYFNYQFPSSICQNCGLNGCTCRNCPPVFQNFGTTSWAQCCGRKHARDVQRTPQAQPKKLARTETYDPSQGRHTNVTNGATGPKDSAAELGSFHVNGQGFDESYAALDLQPPDPPPDFDNFDLDQALMLPDGTQLSDLSEFLLSDLDTANGIGHEEIDHGGGKEKGDAEKDGAVKESEEDEGGGGGGGGCCCGS